jgi:hypothetical protein
MKPATFMRRKPHMKRFIAGRSFKYSQTPPSALHRMNVP